MRAQIYFARLEKGVSDSLEKAYAAMMPAAIRASISCYTRRQERQAVLFGKLLLLRRLKMEHPSIGLQNLQATDAGKPFIPGGPIFNISHSGDVVVLAITQSGRIGIDIEKIESVDPMDFARHFPEIANFGGKFAKAGGNRFFFECWTRKEAVLKGAGQGLLAPLEQVVLQKDAALFWGTLWHTQKIVIQDGYCCHLAADEPLEHITVEHVDLMSGIF
jgi:4'-phosphopantetheinyl transferase